MLPLRSRHEIIVAGAMLLGGLFVIAVATLWPFTFRFHPVSWNQYVARFGLRPDSVLDFPRNILLFMPFGFGLASWLGRRALSHGLILGFTVLAGFLTTLSIESLQMFLPRRTPNISDIIANTMGTTLGLGCLRAWQQPRQLFQWLQARFVLRNIAALFIVWLSLMVLLTWGLMRGMSPAFWNSKYRLALGNELTGNRPWQGKVCNLVIMDRAVQPATAARLLAGEIPAEVSHAVVAVYPLSGETPLNDHTQSLPELVRQGDEAPELTPDGAALRADRWLATDLNVAALAQRVNTTRQFTIALTITTSDLGQRGPARIVTISHGPFHRNLTIGQSREDLVLRWRSLLTGVNGMTPEVEFPGVFGSSQPRRVVVSFDGAAAACYTTDRVGPLKLQLDPEVGLGAILREGSEWPVEAGRSAFWPLKLLLSGLIYFPLGALLGAAVALVRQSAMRLGLLASGLLLSPFFVEGFLAFCRSFHFRWHMFALGVAMTSTGLVAFHLRSNLSGSVQRLAGNAPKLEA